MHQQIPSIEQCGIPSQMPQPIVLCPIQLLYDAQRHAQMMVQHNEEHIQRPQPMLVNVQNTPPWIQNQTPNVIYVQQTSNQMLPYLQPNMIPNPIFQNPYHYPQIIPQESIRPVMQIPTLIHKDTVQNQPANFNYFGAATVHEDMAENSMANINSNEATEKMPFVAQNQVNAAIRNEMMQLNQLNSTLDTETMTVIDRNEVNTTGNVEVIPLIEQQRKPKDKMPLLTQLLNQKPEASENKPIMQNQHVQTDFPIAKTNNNQGPQYVSINNSSQNNEKTNEIKSNSLIIRKIRPLRPNLSKNVEGPVYIKSETMNVRTIYRPILPRPVVRPHEYKGPNFVNPNLVTLRAPDPTQNMMLPNCGVMTNYTVNEDKNIQSVNYNNNKATKIQNIASMSGGKIINPNINNIKDINTQDYETMMKNTVHPTEKIAESKPNLIRIEEICIEEYQVKEYVEEKEKEISVENKEDKVHPLQLDLKPIIQSYMNEIQTRKKVKQEKVGQEKEKVSQVKEKVGQVKEKVGQEKEKVRQKTKKEMNTNKKISITNRNKEEKGNDNGIFILTHVLDGHVIQESNVAFPIHKPVKEKVTYEPYVTPDWKNEPLMPLKYLHVIDNDHQDVGDTVLEIKEDIDNPFSNLMKSTVEAWNTDQLSSHLAKYNWKETATKLKEQEIDGESLFLVTEQQLVSIGICEQHAQLITEFVNKSAAV